MSFALKKQIKRELLDSDWAGKVEEAAVTALANILEEQHGGQLHALYDILRSCTSDLSADGKITAASVQAAAAPNGAAQQVELVEFTDAFSVPRLAFDPVQRKLYVNAKPRHIHATAEAKHQLYLQRLMLIQQRLQRNRMFQQSNLLLPSSNNGGSSVQLTDLQSLMGVFGATRYVLGCISRAEDGRYVLEDTTGSVPLDLSAAETAAGFYTENCVVIAEGSLRHDGAFHVRALGLPPAEPRSALPLAAQRLNLWGGAGGCCEPDSEAGAMLALEESRRGAADRVVVLANVWLDQQEVLDSLHMLMAGFSGVPTVPALFVLMGNFHSRAGAGGGAAAAAGGGGGGGDGMLGGHDVNYATMKELFGQLAALIDQYPRLKAESRFVFVPGPDDPGPGAILPQPPLPRFLTTELRKLLPSAVFASNPVRLRYATQHIVLFRHDLQRRLRRRSLLPLSGSPDGTSAAPSAPGTGSQPATQGPSPAALWGHLSLTLLQQSHLAPLPLLAQPVYWQYDSAMSLYPLPDAVIVADATASQEEFVHEGCRVINPGCLPGGFFAAYLPCVQQVEMSELPRPGEEQSQLQQRQQDEEEGEGGEERDGGEGEGGGLGGIVGGDAVMAEAAADGAAAPRGPRRAQGLLRAPLQQRPQQQQQQQRGQKAAAAAEGKPQKPRAPRQAAGRGRGRGRGRADGSPGEEAPRAAGAGEVAEDGEDVEMAAAPGPQAPGAKAGGRGARAAGRGRGRGAAAAAAAAGGAGRGQGTLAQAWAKQPRRPVAADGGEEVLEDDDCGDVARKRRAAVIEEDEEVEEEEEVIEEVDEEHVEEGEEEEEPAGGQQGRAGKKTWLDDDEEDWREEEDDS